MEQHEILVEQTPSPPIQGLTQTTQNQPRPIRNRVLVVFQEMTD